MERFLQWAWDRHGARYSWMVFAISFAVPLPIYLTLAIAIVAFEGSDRYLGAVLVAAVAVVSIAFGLVLPGLGPWLTVQRWAAGDDVDSADALQASYTWARKAIARGLIVVSACAALLSVAVGLIVGEEPPRLIQYGILGAVVGASSHLIGAHSVPEGPMRPLRAALGGETEVGDSLPRSRPTFAAWSNLSVLGVALSFAVVGAMCSALIRPANQSPVSWVLIGFALTLVFAVPITVVTVFAPSLQPIRDLTDGTKRVAAGDYGHRVPVVQDDDLGVLAASFNRMQAGLAERQRLQAAFGTYVDPGLAARLLEQGDEVFTGERREVTVMFVDIRDFTPFAEANSAEDTVARLNALFEIVVPAVVQAGGHVNKFLGDGALAVFGAPNDLDQHADAAVHVAVQIHQRVADRFQGEVRIGIGINTGTVIAGTIGGGAKLEFTLIGDAVNVAARVEQLTKQTADTILITQQTVDASTSRPPGLIDRGLQAVKGKSAAVRVFGLDTTN